MAFEQICKWMFSQKKRLFQLISLMQKTHASYTVQAITSNLFESSIDVQDTTKKFKRAPFTLYEHWVPI